MKLPLRIMTVALFLLFSIYVGSYFLSVQGVNWACIAGVDKGYPRYRSFPVPARFVETFYRPVHELDRACLRPTKWERPGMAVGVIISP
jgi:hypothetical protein